MQRISIENKKNINGGISQLAIFGIVTLVGAAANLATNIAASVLNNQANSKMAKYTPEEKQTYNYSYKKEPSMYVY